MHNTCSFCGLENLVSTKIVRINSWKGVRTYWYCKKCKAFTLLPRLTELEMNDLYSNYYNNSIDLESANTLEKKFTELEEYLNTNIDIETVLDYGCGVDGYLPSLSGKMHFRVDGFEVSAITLDILRQRQKEVNFFDTESFEKSNSAYDLIVLSDVLEHLAEPKDLLLLLKNRLSAGGKIWIQQPLENNATLFTLLLKGWAFLSRSKTSKMPPFHVSLASRKALFALAKRSGFVIHSYTVTETMWPAKSNIDFMDFKQSLLTLTKYFDYTLSLLFKNYGTRICCILVKKVEKEH